MTLILVIELSMHSGKINNDNNGQNRHLLKSMWAGDQKHISK